jgi:hypothetical protein
VAAVALAQLVLAERLPSGHQRGQQAVCADDEDVEQAVPRANAPDPEPGRDLAEVGDQDLGRLHRRPDPVETDLVPDITEVAGLEDGARDVGDLPPTALGIDGGPGHHVGIEADPFGPGTIRVSALPPETDADAALAVVEALLERATAMDGAPETVLEELADELAASLSCRGAITVNRALSDAEQRTLLADLAVTSNPYRCPHGRPIVLRLGQDEMERRLGRR